MNSSSVPNMLLGAVGDKLKNALRENLKMEDREFVNPWSGDKSSLLLEARAFHEAPVNVDKCCKLITKMLYMLFQGERFTGEEMTGLFFGVTKLFQSNNPRLRRLTYLVIKAMEPSETEAFIVIQCLIKDVNSKTDCNRANAIRVLSKILDTSVANQISDRYLKAAIVDKNSFVASSSLVCGISLMKAIPEVIRRWVNEVHETVLSGGGQQQGTTRDNNNGGQQGTTSSMVQYHALALLYEIKKNDRLALHKVVTSLAKSNLKNPMAECLLIRYAGAALMSPDRDPGMERPLMAYLDSLLKTKHKSETVSHEAARTFVNLIIYESRNGDSACQHIFGYEFSKAIDMLQLSLTSSKSVVRFAACRTLHSLAQVRPELVQRCNQDLEPLLSDPNRSTATLALTSLLKTSNEQSVDKLVKQITSFMSDLGDTYKVEVVKAVKMLGLTYPTKYKPIMFFLSTNLREEGSLEFKRDLVDALIALIQKLPQDGGGGAIVAGSAVVGTTGGGVAGSTTDSSNIVSRGGSAVSQTSQGSSSGNNRPGQVPVHAAKEGLLHLCEFIEDCEFSELSTRILSFLGEMVPRQATPGKFIRFIYNRLILENALVRGAAADALCKIGIKVPSLKNDIATLLECGKNDNDDEIRDRVMLYKDSLTKPNYRNVVIEPISEFSVDALYELCEANFAEDNTGPESPTSSKPIDVSTLPSPEAYEAYKAQQAQAAAKQQQKLVAQALDQPVRDSTISNASGKDRSPSSVIRSGSNFDEMMSKIKKKLGRDPKEVIGTVMNTSRAQPVTELEAEYAVQLIKHVFQQYIILEFYITNTLQGVSLTEVKVDVKPDATKFRQVSQIPIDNLAYNESKSCYCILQKIDNPDATNAVQKLVVTNTGIPSRLSYNQLEDGDDIGFPDETVLEHASILAADYMSATPLPQGQVESLFEQLKQQGEARIKLGLDSFKTLEAAVEGVQNTLNMEACDKTGIVEPGKNAHKLWLSGTFSGGVSVIAKALVGFHQSRILMQLDVASKHTQVAEIVTNFFNL